VYCKKKSIHPKRALHRHGNLEESGISLVVIGDYKNRSCELTFKMVITGSTEKTNRYYSNWGPNRSSPELRTTAVPDLARKPAVCPLEAHANGRDCHGSNNGTDHHGRPPRCSGSGL
jgi:hypothetical protein